MNSGLNLDSAIDQNISSVALLKVLSDSQATGCLTIVANSVTYRLYLTKGELVFATNTVSPFERLERCLRRCYNNTSNSNSLQLGFNFQSKQSAKNSIPPDYQAVCWWVEHNYLNETIVNNLIEKIALEVLESYVFVTEKSVCQFTNDELYLPILKACNLNSLIDKVFENLKIWKDFQPQILSPYQRPYIVTIDHHIAKLTRDTNNKQLFDKLNIRQIAAAINQSEVELLQIIHPLINRQNIKLKEPLYPFNQLPKLEYKQLRKIVTQWSNAQIIIDEIIPQSNYKIVCVDCNWNNLNLLEQSFSQDCIIYSISNPLEALSEIIKYRPNLIFLAWSMPDLDGYELAQLIRKNKYLQQIPIIFVGQKINMISQIKAKLLRVQDYLIEPFTSTDIQLIAQKYLS